jgi:hypothetical protein
VNEEFQAPTALSAAAELPVPTEQGEPSDLEDARKRKYCNIFDQRVAGNSSVNALRHATIDEAVFYVVRATPSAANGPMNSQSDT